MIRLRCGTLLLTACLSLPGIVSNAQTISKQKTRIEFGSTERTAAVDPLIYGQMLENVNDSMIYGGVADKEGREQLHVTPLVKDLNIPVMRWPGGTVVYEYRWRNGIGPRTLRPTVPTLAWKGEESYQFGTDEFLQWSKRVGTEPYINFNMGSHPLYMGTLWEALNWMEYVNGSTETTLGKLRAYHGHEQPYNVKYWCIGNENYLPARAARIQDLDTVYANRLKIWAQAIKNRYPSTQLLAVGRSIPWNQSVLERSGDYLHFLTQHYYVNAKVKAGKLSDPNSTLFAPAKMEAHVVHIGKQLNEWNRANGREDDPIRFSIDEWNNRHAVFDGENYVFSRQSVRKQFDVAVTAGMLNAFVRQSPTVGMANYIFPVNAHGLIRTLGTDDAYLTPIYYLFKQYRSKMLGHKIGLVLNGPGIAASAAQISIDGDAKEISMGEELLTFIDAAAVIDREDKIILSVINRSAAESHELEIKIPDGYKAGIVWELKHPDINAMNTADNRFEIKPSTGKLKEKRNTGFISLLPCAFAMIELEKIINE